MIELPCPESCSYLIDARSHSVEREMMVRKKETADAPRELSLTERSLLALGLIERAIVAAQRGVEGPAVHDLDNAEILAAVEYAIKNLETEESGLIYEHHSAAPRIDSLSRRIREAVDERSEEIPDEARPRRSDVLRALTFTRDAVRAHIQRAADDPDAFRSYMRYISLFYAWPEEASRPLIL